MRIPSLRWVRVAFGGSLLFTSIEAGCLADALYDLADEIDQWAAEVDGEEEDDFSNVVEDIEDWFD